MIEKLTILPDEEVVRLNEREYQEYRRRVLSTIRADEAQWEDPFEHIEDKRLGSPRF